MYSCTVKRRMSSTGRKSYPYSQQLLLHPTLPSSILTNLSGLELANADIYSSQTHQPSKTSNYTGSTWLELGVETVPTSQIKARGPNTKWMSPATSGMQASATSVHSNANTDTYVRSAGRTTKRASTRQSRAVPEPWARRPCYTCCHTVKLFHSKNIVFGTIFLHYYYFLRT